jgi:ABC-type amino acid transport substrate-binding protein
MSLVSDLAPTGVLRASINLGNPVLAQGTPFEPAGVTVDIAREIGSRLGLPVELVCFDAARKSFEAMTSGRADICFLAIEAAREAEVAFTAPYVVIEGVYAVPAESPGLSTHPDRRPQDHGLPLRLADPLRATRLRRRPTPTLRWPTARASSGAGDRNRTRLVSVRSLPNAYCSRQPR